MHVAELKQLFDAIDPSPFRDRDPDPKAEDFIVGWAKDLPHDATYFGIGRYVCLIDSPLLIWLNHKTWDRIEHRNSTNS